MPGPFDAVYEADDDDIEHPNDREFDTDAFRSAMCLPLGVSARDNGLTLENDDPDALAERPLYRRADQTEDAEDHGPNRTYGTDIQQWMEGVSRLAELDDETGEARSEGSSASAGNIIVESCRESVEAAEQFTFEKTLEFVADVIHPGAGRLINIALTIKELVGDAQALASPDSPRDLHVPLFHVAGGLAVDLNVHLPGSGGAGDNAPPVSGFISPGDGGLFGGWEMEIETDRHAEPAHGEAAQSGQDARPEAIGPVGRPKAARTERAQRDGPHESPVITYDLSPLKRHVKDPRRRAVVFRETASRLRTRLYARPEFASLPILVIYDPLADLGMWLVKPDMADGPAGRRIEFWTDLATGMTIVSLE